MIRKFNRRQALRTGATAGGALFLAGCLGFGDEGEPTANDSAPRDEDAETGGEDGRDPPQLPRVENPPAAVYLPTHRESMRHLDPVEAGEFELVPMITYPHVFWNVTGGEVEAAEPSAAGAHLMVTVRDPETGTILPAETGLEMTVGPEGESGSPYSPWPMISQEMGFHVGDNVPLGEDGTYEVDVRVGALDVALAGEFEGRFQDPGAGSFSFEYDDDFRREVVGGIEYLDEELWGERGALAPMGADHDHDHGGDGHGRGEGNHNRSEDDHDRGDGGHGEDHEHGDRAEGDHDEIGGPSRGFGTYERPAGVTELPPAAALPGTLAGTPESGDAILATTVLPRGSRFVDDDSYYLAVSPRTPYNRGMLPMMTIAAAIERNGETVFEAELRDTLDHELGYHYGAPIESVEGEDLLALTVQSPPQVSRHQGYETAFLEMPPVELTLAEPES
ncbi:DUF7350 domain-containing protein [Haloferacaceae archaeon DSL9]